MYASDFIYTIFLLQRIELEINSVNLLDHSVIFPIFVTETEQSCYSIKAIIIMDTTNNTLQNYSSLLSSLFLAWMMFWVILPVLESNDTLFYICTAILGVLLLADLAIAVVVFRRDKQAFFSWMMGTLSEKVLLVAITVAGLLIDYALGLNKLAYFWWFILALDLFAWLLPTPKQTGQPQHDEAA